MRCRPQAHLNSSRFANTHNWTAGLDNPPRVKTRGDTKRIACSATTGTVVIISLGGSSVVGPALVPTRNHPTTSRAAMVAIPTITRRRLGRPKPLTSLVESWSPHLQQLQNYPFSAQAWRWVSGMPSFGKDLLHSFHGFSSQSLRSRYIQT